MGFLNAQLRAKRKLPTGQVTFLLTDLEGVDGLLARLGDEYGRCWPTSAAWCAPRCARPRGTRSTPAGMISSRCSSGRRRRSRRRSRSSVRPGRASGPGMRRPLAHRPASWAPEPHRDRIRGALGAHRRAHLLRGPRWPDLLSAAVRDALSDEIDLTKLGAFRFQGLPEPVTLFQAEVADLPSDFPRCVSQAGRVTEARARSASRARRRPSTRRPGGHGAGGRRPVR